MVHEATLDITMEAKANSRGHSSTRRAATLAREAGVGKLIITHVACAMMTKVVSTCYVNVGQFSRRLNWRMISQCLAFKSKAVVS